MDVSVSEIVAFPPGEHLAYSGITYTLRRNYRLNLRMIFISVFAPICQSPVDAELTYRNYCAEKQLDVSFVFVELGRLLAMSFAS